MILSATMTTISDSLQSLLDSPFTTLLFALGVFGWWRLIARDSILDRPRFWFFMKWPHEGFVGFQNRPKRGLSVYSGGSWYCSKGTFWGELIYCPYCLGWWVALLQFGAYVFAPEIVIGLALAHACRIFSGLLAKHL